MFRSPGVLFDEHSIAHLERKHPLMSHSQASLDFPLLARRTVQVGFTGGNLSSDGGLLLLAQLDRRIGLTEWAAGCIRDWRLPERVKHSLLDLLRQRIYQIAAGYEDCNDADALRRDPALKVAVGRAPVSDPDLASQPTLSRLEQMVSEAECAAMNEVLFWHFLQLPRKAPREVVLDMDASEDPTHGQQELALFNAHYGGYCYLPQFVFARVPREGEEYLVSAELPETHTKEVDILLATLQRLVEGLRARWPGVKVVFRADAWYAVPEIYDWCEDRGVAYAIGLPANPVLDRESHGWRQDAATAAANSPGGSARRFGEFPYQAETWRRQRWVVVKAEQTALGPNRRYVVTEGLRGKPRQRYQFYCGRGESENRLKEMKGSIQFDRLSCMDFASNKVRLVLYCLAYVLFQRLRRVARGTGLGRAQVERLRLALIKIAARVKASLRRVQVELCSSCPSQALWRLLARRLGVAPG
jgi:Transposase DDE domain group 1